MKLLLYPILVIVLLQSGYAADLLLELCLDSFNGLFNKPALLASEREPDPEFFQVLSLIREVQDAGAFGMKIDEATEGQSAFVLFFRDEKATDDILMKLDKIRSLLDVTPDQQQFELVYSPLPGGPDKPKDNYISISYEDEWFWIANDDWKSKRIFRSILFLFTLMDAGGTENFPTITIPTY